MMAWRTASCDEAGNHGSALQAREMHMVKRMNGEVTRDVRAQLCDGATMLVKRLYSMKAHLWVGLVCVPRLSRRATCITLRRVRIL